MAVALGLARIGEYWSHKASTPFNKNMVGDDGPFRHGPNEPPESANCVGQWPCMVIIMSDDMLYYMC